MVFIIGLTLGFGLILGIGAQNIFVLKQALKKEYAIVTAFICFICDVCLILLSILLTTTMANYIPMFKPIMLLAAIIFLFYYSYLSLKSSFVKEKDIEFKLSSETKNSLLKIILLSMSFSLLNPQAILDLVVLLGGVASNYHSNYLKIEFMLGVSFASFIWFFILVYLGIWLGKFIKNVKVWRWVERVAASFMLFLAIDCSYLFFNTVFN